MDWVDSMCQNTARKVQIYPSNFDYGLKLSSVILRVGALLGGQGKIRDDLGKGMNGPKCNGG